MNWEDRITLDPAVLVEKPVIKETRLAVEFIVGLKAQGWSDAEILRNYPGSDARGSPGLLRIRHGDFRARVKTFFD